MRYSFLDPWHAFLPREAGHVVALCGSGGKTSLLMEIARLWAAEGLPVVATTTTRTEQLADVLAVDSTATTAAAATAPVVYRHGGVRADGKWEGIAASVVDAIDSELPGRLVVVEVDAYVLGDRIEVDRRVGGAADRRVHHDHVLEGFPRHDLGGP